MRIRDLLATGAFLVVAFCHFGLQWYGWHLHLQEVPATEPFLDVRGDTLWNVCSLPLFAVTPRRIQTLYFFEMLFANSVLWGLVGAWTSLVVLPRGRHERRRSDQRARASATTEKSSEPPRTLADRIVELKRLRDQGLISSEEYQRQRETILTKV